MRMGKKLAAAVVLASALLSASANAADAVGNWEDYTLPADAQQHWAAAQLEDLTASDILHGYEETPGVRTIQPQRLITRAEFAQLLVSAVGESRLAGYSAHDKTFADVPADAWFYPAIHLLASIGFVEGTDDTHFAPNRNIRRDEMAKMIHNVFTVDDPGPGVVPVFTDVPAGYWAKPFIDRLGKRNLIHGYEDGTFRPGNNATRAEAATLIYNALHEYGKTTGGTDEALTQLVLNREKEGNLLLQSGDYQQIFAFDEKYATGKALAVEDANTNELIGLTDEGVTLHSQLSTEPKAEIVEQSPFRAVVRLTDAVYETEATKNGQTVRSSQDSSGLLYLKRDMPGGTWKIYDILPIPE